MIRRTAAALRRMVKAFTMRWTGRASTWWSYLLPRTDFDYAREVGDGTSSNIVVAVLNWIARTFPEAPVQVVEELPDGRRRPEVGHGMVRLIERPNSFYSGVALWMATMFDWAADGNAYWLKVRAGSGSPVELWWAPSWTMQPKWSDDGSDFISHYEYRPNALGQVFKIAPTDVVHFRYGLDPQNTRKGLSQLRSLAREIFTDDEAANFTASLMKNLGVPGVVLAPENPIQGISQEDAKQIKDDFLAKFGGDRRGEPMVMTAPTKVQVLAFSPEQMNLRNLRRVPEERVTAVYGVAAVVVGLGAGLDRSTFQNFAEAREAAYEGNIIPTQRLIAADLELQLLPDFEEGRRLASRHVEFDLNRVRVLQPDVDKLFERMNRAVTGGWATVGDARRAVGLPAGPEHEAYLRSLAVVEILAPRTKLALGPGTKATKGLDEFVGAMTEARARLGQRYEPELQRFFRAQARRVRQRLSVVAVLRSANGARLKGTISADGLLPKEEDDLLAATLAPLWAAGMELGWSLASQSFALDMAFDLANATVAAAMTQGIFRAKRVNDGTRSSIQEALEAGQSRGYSVQQIIFGVPDEDFAGILDRAESYYENRPGIIAATESMWSSNEGSASLYRQQGIARVQMIDPGDDEACVARNGLVVRLETGLAALSDEHPNGRLTLVPA